MTPQCRLAFTGRALAFSNDPEYRTSFFPRLCIFKHKHRQGVVDRLHDSDTVIGRGLFKKETQLDVFTGLAVTLSTGEKGVIEGGFGQSGKFKVRCMGGLSQPTIAALKKPGKKGKEEDAEKDGDKAQADAITISLDFKRFIFDDGKKMHQ